MASPQRPKRFVNGVERPRGQRTDRPGTQGRAGFNPKVKLDASAVRDVRADTRSERYNVSQPGAQAQRKASDLQNDRLNRGRLPKTSPRGPLRF